MKKIIVIAIILILIGGGVLILIKKNKPAVEQPGTPSPSQQEKGSAVNNTPATKSEEETVDPYVSLKAELTLKARFFLEHYFTYSIDSGYENLRELLSMMSGKMRAEAEAKITRGVKADLPPEILAQGGFYGITTKVLSLNLETFSPETIVIFSGSLQQQEAKSGITNILYKNAQINFVNEGGTWKVDSVEIK